MMSKNVSNISREQAALQVRRAVSAGAAQGATKQNIPLWRRLWKNKVIEPPARIDVLYPINENEAVRRILARVRYVSSAHTRSIREQSRPPVYRYSEGFQCSDLIMSLGGGAYRDFARRDSNDKSVRYEIPQQRLHGLAKQVFDYCQAAGLNPITGQYYHVRLHMDTPAIFIRWNIPSVDRV